MRSKCGQLHLVTGIARASVYRQGAVDNNQRLELILYCLGTLFAVPPQEVPSDREADDSDSDGDSSHSGAVRLGTGKQLTALPYGRHPCCGCSKTYIQHPHPVGPVRIIRQGKIVKRTAWQTMTLLKAPVRPQHAARDVEAKQAQGAKTSPSLTLRCEAWMKSSTPPAATTALTAAKNSPSLTSPVSLIPEP